MIERTLLREEQIGVLEELLQHALFFYSIGHLAEIGIYKGGISKVMARTAPNRRVYACDTFTGIPTEHFDPKIDRIAIGTFQSDFEEVFTYLDLPNIHVIKGCFPHPTIHKGMELCQFAFVHLDVDLYRSTLEAIKFFYPRMIKGGIILSDDYKWPQCPGIEKAFKEYFSEDEIIDTGVNSCYVVKK